MTYLNIEQYLERIGYAGNICLHKLHSQHVSRVPFENINPYTGCLVDLNPERIFERVVLQGCGGGCYELNGLFYELLLGIGFKATLVAAKLYKGDAVDEESLHAVIIAKHEGKLWYVDPGYGEDGVLYPLELTVDIVQQQEGYFYRFSSEGNQLVFARSKMGKVWQKLLLIDLQPVSLDYFDARALYHQTSMNSWFKNNFTCSLISENQRKTVLNKKYSCSNTVLHITSPDELYTLLTKEFGLQIPLELAHKIFTQAL
jgi:N-hydroxyarylamine O-acetyltransferase